MVTTASFVPFATSANTFLAQALFTSQAALAEAGETVLVESTPLLQWKNEIAHFGIAASLFAAHYPGSRDRYDADPSESNRMAEEIFKLVGHLKTSILRNHPEQAGAGLLTVPRLVKLFVADIPQDIYDATVERALHSASLFATLAAARPSSAVALLDRSGDDLGSDLYLDGDEAPPQWAVTPFFAPGADDPDDSDEPRDL